MTYDRKNIWLVIFIGLAIVACSESPEPPKIIPPATSVVAAHTSGTISREDRIRVHFTKDMVPDERLNVSFEKSPITFDPEISGSASWIQRRTLEFVPQRSLPPHQDITATIHLTELMENLEGIETFVFNFTTMKQTMEITVEGLNPESPETPLKQRLNGTITTADIEKGTRLETVLQATQSGSALPIQWRHSEDGRRHDFVINNIVRGKSATPVELVWDGTPIKADQKGKKIITVPAEDTFEVAFARAVQGPERYVEVRFSDSLERNQNLNGLIRVKDRQDMKFNIMENLVRIYSQGGWAGEFTIEISAGIRNTQRRPLKEAKVLTVFFEDVKPQIRFAGKGVILPTSQGQTIPVETMNLRAIRVTATQIFADNIPQYLQVNRMEGQHEVERVGRTIWRKTIRLNWSPEHRNRWVRHGLDVAPLIASNPGGIYRLSLSFIRSHITYPCPVKATDSDGLKEAGDASVEDEEDETSNWDAAEQYGEYDWNEYYQNRDNPCHSAYYHKYFGGRNLTVSRNLLISDIGILAKQGGNKEIFTALTDLKTAQPLPDVAFKILDYQLQQIAEGQTGEDGTAIVKADRKPFLVVVKDGEQQGFLRMDDGSALSVSHFDVSGQTVKKGLKGFIYGERGVWRPGDPIYLTFIRMDADNPLPLDHPVHFELVNPRGQRVKTITRKESLNGFYSFHVNTDADAPTGNWRARVKMGGATFEKALKVEMVRPNRLKIDLNFGPETESLTKGRVKADLSAAWLHGAPAKGLKTDVELMFRGRQTVFPQYPAYRFDDPVRKYQPESSILFEGRLDKDGHTPIDADVHTENMSPGMLTASFKTRVFEPGGAFSTDHFSMPYHPYDSYVGISVPRGDASRGMLLTDTDHIVRFAVLDNKGKPLSSGDLEVELYKVKWRWWWEKGADSLADYIGTDAYTAIQKESVSITNGMGQWTFRIEYPQWGRYLIRAKLRGAKHITGDVVYIDWPGWAGRAQKDTPGGATVLTFSADKPSYKVGETVTLTIPTGQNGRGLVSIETGSRVLSTTWITGSQEPARFQFTVTPDMAPNIFAHVTFLQPHHQTANDLPIRMYGVIPIVVEDPATRLTPVIKVPDVFKPEETAAITVKEAAGKPMTYTVAVVDEGLLGLTRYSVSNPWEHFYKREALGVKTWDVFDDVIGAYGGALEQLLSIGGDDQAQPAGKKKANRFPPMVRFIGPFELPAGKENTHEIEIPLYVGAVRVMVVAGHQQAFGAAQKSVFVRKPLMVLGSLPRVLGPDEEVDLAVTVFAMEESVRKATVQVHTDGPISLSGQAVKSVTFTAPGEKILAFRLKGGEKPGIGRILIEATGGGQRTSQQIELDIRQSASPVTDVTAGTIQPGKSWQQEIIFPGNPGTNRITLEVSRIPPLNLESRLDFLVRYPHGCAEQTVSAVFPQLYLDKLMALSPEQQDKIQENIEAGVRRLRKFQRTDGGFGLWPGAVQADPWATTYAGHFLLEAQRAGYLVPADLIEAWKSYQRDHTLGWVTGPARSELVQAYRLYCLALSGSAEMGAMNRLMEEPGLPAAARWRLAAAYQLAGHPVAAQSLTHNVDIDIPAYRELSNTYGSDIRDRAMILEALCLMGRLAEARVLSEKISSELAGDKWLSTQTTAFALVAMAHVTGLTTDDAETVFSFTWNDGPKETVTSPMPIVQRLLKAGEGVQGTLHLNNLSNRLLYPRVVVKGLPQAGSETVARNGFSLSVTYLNLDGETIDPIRLDQGTDVTVKVSVTNTAKSGTYHEVALTHPTASGLEIRNTRMETTPETELPVIDYRDVRDDRVYTYFDLKKGETKTFTLRVNASFIGRFYLPMVAVETMYDASINARVPGQWINIAPVGDGGP